MATQKPATKKAAAPVAPAKVKAPAKTKAEPVVEAVAEEAMDVTGAEVEVGTQEYINADALVFDVTAGKKFSGLSAGEVMGLIDSIVGKVPKITITVSGKMPE